MTAQRLARELAGGQSGKSSSESSSIMWSPRSKILQPRLHVDGGDTTPPNGAQGMLGGDVRRSAATAFTNPLRPLLGTVSGERPWGRPPGARRCDGTRAQANESSTPAGATELRMTSIACCHGGVASRTLRQGPTEVKPFADRDSFVIFLPLGIGRPPEEFTLGPTVMTDGRR